MFSSSSLFKVVAVVSVLIPSLMFQGCSPPKTLVVEPVEIDEVLVNPGMGFTTFYSFNHDEINANHPECSIVYFRWYWDVLEPEDGKVNFAMIDSILELCRERGQKLAFRVMCQNGHEVADKSADDRMEVPRWYKDSGASGFHYPDGKRWMPDYDSEVFFEKHGRLIRALAERYDGHPDIDHVDIGSIGHWGEWHTEGLNYQHMPLLENQFRMVDIYLESFKQTPLIMQVDAHEALKYAISKGTGVRADCVGDMTENRFFEKDGTPTNHMLIRYPRAFGLEGMSEVWKTAPIVFETCGNFQWWYDEGWDVDFIFNKILEWHMSALNNKSFPIPEAWWPKVEELQKKMGYRYVLKRLEHKDRAKAGKTLALEMLWENKGVAPCYLKHPVAFQLRNTGSGAVQSFETDIDITGWLPGEHRVSARLELPSGLASGSYDIYIAFLDPQSLKPGIKLAIGGLGQESWYRLSRVEIKS